MRPCLLLPTAPLTVDEKIAVDQMLGRLPGVHHVEWGTRPLPHVNIVYEDPRFVDSSRAKGVLRMAGCAIPAVAPDEVSA